MEIKQIAQVEWLYGRVVDGMILTEDGRKYAIRFADCEGLKEWDRVAFCLPRRQRRGKLRARKVIPLP